MVLDAAVVLPHAMQMEQEECSRVGVDATLAKPIRQKDLLDLLGVSV